MVQVTSEIQQRIIAAAEQLHSENPERLPTVAEVRAASKADMNSVSIVMKQWRQNKIMPVQKIEEQAPNEILVQAQALATAIWTTAKEQAEYKLREAEARYNEERTEAESLRVELSDACDSLQQQLDNTTAAKEQAQTIAIQAEGALQNAQGKIAQLQKAQAQAEQAEALAAAKNAELEKHIATLKADLEQVKEQQKAQEQQYRKELAAAQEQATASKAEHEYTITQLKAEAKAKEEVIVRLTVENGDLQKVEKALIAKVADVEKVAIQAKADTSIATAAATQAHAHIQDLKTFIEKITPQGGREGKEIK